MMNCKSVKLCQWLLGAAAVVALVGCGGYGKVSPLTYDYAKSLYNISNRRLDDRLGPIKEQVQASLADGAISDREANWLTDIIDDAENHDWKRAMNSARQIMEDQVTLREMST